MLSRTGQAGFWRDERGGVAVEATVILLPLMLIIFTVFELGLNFYVALSSQKAAQLGARLAVVNDPVYIAPNMPRENAVHYRYGEIGDACFQPSGSDACLDPGGPWVCAYSAGADGGNCDTARFTRILQEMQAVYPSLDPNVVSITYEYKRLGYAGGPFVPFVTVTVAKRTSPIQIISLLDVAEGLRLLDNGITLGAVSAGAFAEDLDSAR